MKHTLPQNKVQEAILRRSYFLTDTKWKPLRDIPCHKNRKPNDVHAAGEVVTGMPYSSTEVVDKFIGENVSFHTFVSALNNPDSVLYTRDILDAKNGSTYYGCVCNETVRFALDIPQRYNCLRWLEMPGMRVVKEAGEYTADEIELFDILHVYDDKRNHVALITDIIRDDDDKIVKIEVSEAAIPQCRRASYDLETYFENYAAFRLCRYDHVNDASDYSTEDDELLFSDAMLDRVVPSVAVDFGDKANCLAGEKVVVSAFTEGGCDVEITRDGQPFEVVRFDGVGKVERYFERGTYVMKNSVTGEATTLRVNEPKIEFSIENGILNVRVDPMDDESEIIYMDMRGPGERTGALLKVCHLTDEERKSGVFSREVPEGMGNFKIYFRNPFGIWTSGYVHTV